MHIREVALSQETHDAQRDDEAHRTVMDEVKRRGRTLRTPCHAQEGMTRISSFRHPGGKSTASRVKSGIPQCRSALRVLLLGMTPRPSRNASRQTMPALLVAGTQSSRERTGFAVIMDKPRGNCRHNI